MSLVDSYTKVAKDYADHIYHELENKPKDRELLDQFAEQLGRNAVVLDLGCGPGHVTKYLEDKNLDMTGIDVAPGMIQEAKKRNPKINFEIGDLEALDYPDQSVDGIVAFYSLIHVSGAHLRLTFKRLKDILKPGGLLFIAFHIGDETIHLDNWWGSKVHLEFHFYPVQDMEDYATTVEFEVLYKFERDPYEEFIEHQSRRAYMLFKKPI